MFDSYRAPAMLTTLFFGLILLQSVGLRASEQKVILEQIIFELLAISASVVLVMALVMIVKLKSAWFQFSLQRNSWFGWDNMKSVGMYVLVWMSSQSQWFIIGWFSSLSLVGSALGFLILAAPLQIFERVFQPKYLMSLRESESININLRVLFSFMLRNTVAILFIFSALITFADLVFEHVLGGRYLDQKYLLIYLLVMAFLQMLAAGLSGLNRIYSTYKAIYWAYGTSPLVSLSFFIVVGYENLTVELIYISMILALCSQVLMLTASVAWHAKR
jgi:hypothetical protein